MKIGATARVKPPVIAGLIADKRFNKEADEPEVLLVFPDPVEKDADGKPVVHHRWFLESKLEEIGAPAPATAPTEVKQ